MAIDEVTLGDCFKTTTERASVGNSDVSHVWLKIESTCGKGSVYVDDGFFNGDMCHSERPCDDPGEGGYQYRGVYCHGREDSENIPTPFTPGDDGPDLGEVLDPNKNPGLPSGPKF